MLECFQTKAHRFACRTTKKGTGDQLIHTPDGTQQGWWSLYILAQMQVSPVAKSTFRSFAKIPIALCPVGANQEQFRFLSAGGLGETGLQLGVCVPIPTIIGRIGSHCRVLWSSAGEKARDSTKRSARRYVCSLKVPHGRLRLMHILDLFALNPRNIFPNAVAFDSARTPSQRARDDHMHQA